jgi:hypothetical protein
VRLIAEGCGERASIVEITEEAGGPGRVPRAGPDEESCYQHAEDEPADVGEERDAAPVGLGVEPPEAPSISWYRDGNCHGHLG